ncbi:MAG: recombinase family protein [Lachnospiraceae bacterium]|nr:recombinase family protein [Lachnospiraceae bacterium]
MQLKGRQFYAAMYLRLSREDEDRGAKSESNSIKSQRELVKSFLREQPDIELYDIYVDDGFSGSSFDRPEFKRMIEDIEAGRVNCVVVKDLSRFGRDYIESGRYIQKTFPALGVRFIALTDHYDSMSADAGESSIVLPVKNFINDSYCRDISTKVKSQLKVKYKNGQCIAAFAVYGYRKSDTDKNRLAIDAYAAENVRRIFAWKIEGLAISAIAQKLNSLGILSPKEYKKSMGLSYNGGFCKTGGSEWGSSTVKRILTNEVYLGHMVQGKTEKVNYKVKRHIAKPEGEWVKVENTHQAIVSADDFAVVQHLLKADGRKSPESGTPSPFMGLLFCGGCGEQMVRRVVRYKGTAKVYYICSTNNRGEGCSRHSIEENTLQEIVRWSICKYANTFLKEKELSDRAVQCRTNFGAAVRYDRELERMKKERDKYSSLCCGLHEDLRNGIVTKEEFERLHSGFFRRRRALEDAMLRQEELIKRMLKNGVLCARRLKAFQDCAELREIDRRTLSSLVRRIAVCEKKQVVIDFYFMDVFEMMSKPARKRLTDGEKEAEKKTKKTERGA